VRRARGPYGFIRATGLLPFNCSGRISRTGFRWKPDFDQRLAGVPIDLIIRGFCCLRPGVPGHTENIRIRSIIGRFLEHSRIFYFANGGLDPADGEYYIGSADWMFRNLSKRIEVVTPIFAAGPRQRLREILDICLRGQREAWVLDMEGKYEQPWSGIGIDWP
jgi:polyphosphate kinase